jgi:hypothetical protein
LLLGPPPELWIPPPEPGSGNPAMPCARMHRENLSARWYSAGLGGVVTFAPRSATVVPVVLPMLATGGADAPPPQAAISKLRQARVRVRAPVIAKRRLRRSWGRDWCRFMTHVLAQRG